MSSVREEVSGATLANQIRMERAGHKGAFLLVEGSADSTFFRKFVNEDECIITVCLGKENVIEAIAILEKKSFNGVLGVLDKDFSDLVGYPQFYGAIIFTDRNDVEMMILFSTAIYNIILEFGDNDRIDALEEAAGKSISDIVCDAASFLGTLRMLSLREGWHLKFDGMTYRFIARNSFELDEMRTVQHVLGRSNARPPLSDDELVELVNLERNKFESKQDVSCGHDCVRIFGRALALRIGNSNQFNSSTGAIILEKIMRVAYEYRDFTQTNLHRGIRFWEQATGFRVLRET